MPQFSKSIIEQDLFKVSESIRLKKLSPVDVVNACLKKIHRLEPKINAFITVLKDEAVEEASSAESEIKMNKWRGPLHGVPVAVKDFYDTAGIRTTAAFKQFKDRIPKKDAAVVSMLKENGAILIGKTNMHQLGMGTTSVKSYYGAVHSPINSRYVAGGSSGGSAAAVFSGMCFATIDTDAVGSCRIPSACCGVIGFKTSNGLIDMHGILEGEKADEVIMKFSAAGITCRSVQDIEIVLKALAANLKKPGSDVNSLRIGIVQNFAANDEIRKSFLKITKRIKTLNNKSENVEIPFDKAQFDIKNLEKDRSSVNKLLFDKVDLLVLPTLSDYIPTIIRAKKKGDQAIAPANTFFCNYFGLPAISVPYAKDSKGLPLAFQIVGKPMHDLEVLEFAKSFGSNNAYKLLK